jgi:hypothetical protein
MSDTITAVASPFSLLLTWPDVSNYHHYSVHYKKSTDAVYALFDEALFYNEAFIYDLNPSTTYDLRVYTTDATTFIKTLSYESALTTLGATVQNVSKAALLRTSYYNLDALSAASTALLSTTRAALATSIFDAGDSVRCQTPYGKANSTLLKVGGTASSVKRNKKFFIPFESSGSVTLTLSDNSSKVASYASSKITVDGVQYSSGEQFVLDGKLVTVTTDE